MSEAGTQARNLLDPAEIRGYFVRTAEIIGHLRTVVRMGSQPEYGAQEVDILDGHLRDLQGTMRALTTKYGYAGYFAERLPSALEISDHGRGLPTAMEIRRLEADRTTARSMPDEEVAIDLRGEMLDHILQLRRPPRDAQFRQSQARYMRMLRERSVMGLRSALRVSPAGTATRTVLLDWCTWDGTANAPSIYVMRCEDTGARPLAEDEDRMSSLSRSLFSMSQANITPLTIATQVDEAISTLHPIQVKRLSVGPFMADGFCPSEECSLSEALSHVSDAWRLNWAVAWKVEALRSKGSKLVKSFLQERRVQIFDIDPMDRTSVLNGTTTMATRLLVPYDVYQAMQGPPGGSLASAQMFMVDADGNVASNF